MDQKLSPPPTAAVEEGVFGSTLNKKPKQRTDRDAVGKEGSDGGERKSVWKLRRWSKGRGHHTVIVNGDGERDGDKQKSEDVNKEDTESGASCEEERNKVCKIRNVILLDFLTCSNDLD